MKKILFIAVMLIAYNFSYSQSIKLSYNLKKGQTYSYENKMNMDMTQEMMGQEMKMTTDISMNYKYFVENVSSKEITFIQTYSETKTHVTSPMFDSTMTSKELMGKNIKLIIKPDGETVKTDIPDSIKAELSGMTINSKLIKFPDNNLKFGDKWKDSIQDTIDQMGGKINNLSSVEYTLVKKENKNNHDCYLLNVTGDMNIDGKFVQMGMEMYMEGKGKISGTIFVDAKTGMVVYEESQIELSSTVSVSGQENMIIPMTQKMNGTRTLIENKYN